VFHWRLPLIRKSEFIVSHLRYATITRVQYLVIVKLPGSFRLAAGNRHLYRYCIFTGHLVETVLQSLRLSCGPELTRQGITLNLLNPFYGILHVAMKFGPYLSLTSFLRSSRSDVWPLRILKFIDIYAYSFLEPLFVFLLNPSLQDVSLYSSS